MQPAVADALQVLRGALLVVRHLPRPPRPAAAVINAIVTPSAPSAPVPAKTRVGDTLSQTLPDAATPLADVATPPSKLHMQPIPATGNDTSVKSTVTVTLDSAVNNDLPPTTETPPPTDTDTSVNRDPSDSPPAHDDAQTSMRERHVPQSPLARFAAFTSLGASLLTGAAAEATRRTFTRSPSSSGSAFMTEANAARLAASLSRMRGAALKLGQMLSIQDESVVPAPLAAALARVRQNADVMPQAQLYATLAAEYGTDDWQAKLGVSEFDDKPIAAASIGQVHRVVALDDSGERNVELALKVQYPGVATAIKSDINNVRRLITISRLAPDSFYLDDALDAAERELADECDYAAERAAQDDYREKVLADDKLKGFYVPFTVPRLCTPRVLAAELVSGTPIHEAASLSKARRDDLAARMLRLTLRELFVLRLQQSDPNWANYLYDAESDTINLIDFGAARRYPDEFLTSYLRLILACASREEDAIVTHSVALGFLTGEESKQMIAAHISASLAVGEPFAHQGLYDFTHCDIPARTAEFGRVMLDQRLTAPPKEAYSLHRRLSGAFLLSTKLAAAVDARALLNETVDELTATGRF